MSGDYSKEQIRLRNLVAGKRETVRQFYEKNFAMIRGYVQQNEGNLQDAEDIFQDALVALYQQHKAKPIELSCALPTYFYAICKNLWRNRMRKQQRIQLSETLSEELSELTLATEDWEIKTQEFLFQKCFVQLGAACQKVLTMVFDGCSMKTIATKMNYTEAYARVKNHDCKKALTQKITKDPLYTELQNATKTTPK